MGKSYAPILFQRMNPQGVGITHPDDPPTIGVVAMEAVAVEGDELFFAVQRLSGLRTSEVRIHVEMTSAAGAGDFSGATSFDLIIPANDTSTLFGVQTVNRTGVQGDRAIRATISKVDPIDDIIISSTSSFAVITLSDFVAPIPPDPTTDFVKYQPDIPVSRWHCVGFNIAGAKATYPSGYSGLLAAMGAANLVPGDVIKLADGTYNGNTVTVVPSGAGTVVSKNGNYLATGAEHIMIAARNHLRVTLNFQLFIKCKNWWLTGLILPKFAQSAITNPPSYSQKCTAVVCFNDGIWVTNCLFPNGLAVRYDYDDHFAGAIRYLNMAINYCTIKDIPANIANGVSIAIHNVRSNDGAPRNSTLARCLFDNSIEPNDFADNDHEQRIALYLQPSKPDNAVANEQTYIVSHCLLRGKWRYMMYTKRNVTYQWCFYRPTPVRGVGQGPLIQRHGAINTGAGSRALYNTGGIIKGCTFDLSGGCNVNLELNGYGQTVIGNRVINKGSRNAQINVQAGGSTPSNTNIKNAGDWMSIVDNLGFDTIGMGDLADNTGGHVLNQSYGGWPNNVRILKGSSGWNPTIVRYKALVGGSVTTCPISAYEVFNGFTDGIDTYAPVTAITEAELLVNCGCDPAA